MRMPLLLGERAAEAAMHGPGRRGCQCAGWRTIALPRERNNADTAVERAEAAERQLAALRGSTSGRITAPLRRLAAAWRSLRRGAS
jgi:hypothetical protein